MMMSNGYNRNEQAALFDEIAQLSFALDEIRLFLDTHPDNRDALELYGKYGAKRRESVEKYTKAFGPIDAYNVNTENGWSWIDEPMPWRMEGN